MSNSASPLHPGDPSSLGGYRMRGRLGRDVPEFRPYPDVTGEEGGRDEEPVNNLKLACEFHSDGDDGVPTAELSFWVNDRLAATAEGPEPVPEEYVDGTLVREQPLLYDRGQSNDPLRILYESYHLHEIRD